MYLSCLKSVKSAKNHVTRNISSLKKNRVESIRLQKRLFRSVTGFLKYILETYSSTCWSFVLRWITIFCGCLIENFLLDPVGWSGSFCCSMPDRSFSLDSIEIFFNPDKIVPSDTSDSREQTEVASKQALHAMVRLGWDWKNARANEINKCSSFAENFCVYSHQGHKVVSKSNVWKNTRKKK